jgi:hypothetical protein
VAITMVAGVVMIIWGLWRRTGSSRVEPARTVGRV